MSIASFKILEFDLNGSFIREFNTYFYARDLYAFDNGDYLFSNFRQTKDQENLVVLADSLGNIKSALYAKNPQYGIESSDNRELIVIEDGIHFISPQIENTIYTYNGDSLTKSFAFCILPEIPSRFYHSNIAPPFLKENYYRSVYRESSNWVNLIYCTLEKKTIHRWREFQKRYGRYRTHFLPFRIQRKCFHQLCET